MQDQNNSHKDEVKEPKYDMQTYVDDDFGSIRVVMIDNEPWFVAMDVCRALEIVNHKDALSRLDDDEKSGVGLTDPHGREQITNIINEPGLYTLVLGSRKPEAKAFKRWVTHEVLPSIRKSGQYVPGSADSASICSPIQDQDGTCRTDVENMEFYDMTGMLCQISGLESGLPTDTALPSPGAGSGIVIRIGNWSVQISDDFRVDTLEKVLEVMGNVQRCGGL